MALNIKEVLKELRASLKQYVDDMASKKVDKKDGYSLMSDSEINRLKDVTNYDDSRIQAVLDRKIEYIPAEYIDETELTGVLSSYSKTEHTHSQYATTSYVQSEIAKIDTSVESGSGGTTGTTTTLPSYWTTRLDEIGEKIDALQKQYGMDTFQFLWCSDIHGVSGTAPSRTDDIGNIGRYMMDKYNIPFFAVSGDIMSQASHTKVESIWAEYDKLTPMLSPIKNEEFLAVRGNHDGMWGSPITVNGQANQYYHSYIGSQALFNAFMRRQTLDKGERVFGRDGMYFYVDFHNIRFYMLNTHTCGDESTNADGAQVYNGFKHPAFGNEQLQWVADTLMTVKDNQKVIFMGHAPINSVADGSVFNSVINMFVLRTSGTKTGTVTGTFWGTDQQYTNISVTADFTNAKGSIIGWFNGHIHSDSINTSAYSNLPMISITTAGGDVRDTYYTDGTLTRQQKTAIETAIDVVTVTSDYIYCTRIGSGYDRKLNLATKEVTIDYESAYIPPADGGDTPTTPTLTQGDITSEVGYTHGYIFAQETTDGTESASFTANDLYATTGLIDVVPNDVIRIKGMTWETTSSNSNIVMYSDDKTKIWKIRSLYNGCSNTTGVTFNFPSTDLIEITVTQDMLSNSSSAGSFKGTAIQICGKHTAGTSIVITRNSTDMSGGSSSGGSTPSTPEIDATVPTNLISTDVSTYTLNKKYSGNTIVDGNGYCLTEIIPVDFSKQPYLHIKGLYISGDTNTPTFYKIGFYQDGVLTVDYTNNLGFVTNNNKAEQTILFSEDYYKYDSMQLSIYVSDTEITTSDVIVDGSISVVLSNSSTFVGWDDVVGGTTPDIPTLTQGDITSSVTWTTDQRYSTSTGTLKTQAGWSSTGHIEVEPNDVIRIKGTGFFSETSSGNCVVVAFDSTGTFITSSGAYIFGGNIDRDVTNGNYHVKSIGTDGIEITNSGSATRYFAITVKGTDTSSAIITRNMEI